MTCCTKSTNYSSRLSFYRKIFLQTNLAPDYILCFKITIKWLLSTAMKSTCLSTDIWKNPVNSAIIIFIFSIFRFSPFRLHVWLWVECAECRTGQYRNSTGRADVAIAKGCAFRRSRGFLASKRRGAGWTLWESNRLHDHFGVRWAFKIACYIKYYFKVLCESAKSKALQRRLGFHQKQQQHQNANPADEQRKTPSRINQQDGQQPQTSNSQPAYGWFSRFILFFFYKFVTGLNRADLSNPMRSGNTALQQQQRDREFRAQQTVVSASGGNSLPMPPKGSYRSIAHQQDRQGVADNSALIKVSFIVK